MVVKNKIYLFIDTSIFRRYHFDTWSGVFETICRLCNDNAMCNFTTDITLKELDANISEYATEVSKCLAKVHKYIGHTAIYKKHGFDEINSGIIEQELWDSLIDFYQFSKTEFVGMPDNPEFNHEVQHGQLRGVIYSPSISWAGY